MLGLGTNLSNFSPADHSLYVGVEILFSDLDSNLAPIECMAGGLDSILSCSEGGATGGAGLVWLCNKHLCLAYHWSQQYITI